MKRIIVFFLVGVMMLIMTACEEKTTSVVTEVINETEKQEKQRDVTAETKLTTESEESTDIIYLESDLLPESWHGNWVCTYSEANYFKESETIFIKDFDNAFLYTENIGDQTYENNRWFCYDEDTQIVHIFNEQPFEENWIRDSFEIKKASESELVFTRVGTGQEVRFEKKG